MPTAARIDGKAMAAELTAEIREQAAALQREHDIQPGLAVVIVGDDPASHVYVRNKKRTAESCGFHSVQHDLDAATPQDELLDLIARLNHDPKVHGILVQLPLPDQLDEQRVTQSILPGKDVDGFHFENIGRLTAGDVDNAFVPCTPAGCMRMIERQIGTDLSGMNAVVIGRSNIVGKPMASLLLRANATVTICHSRTRDLPVAARGADILVAAVGRPEMVRGDWIKPGAIVIDVGINRVESDDGGHRLTGDVAYEEASGTAAAISPVPGGVGPMTIAMLMANTLKAARAAAPR
ncbi:MAG: bifunctional methylenetetrahydrofolate dehydrogenase/methenyltetrahydrofolate cyclohydrolase FolD [Woeseiaceae bacterium]|nr:bifunctional methylenetetrahydrofolate dehydrogenase/methenyltetrahydrofolate cyclohydrolase FolD [Woeseiaceae bacterium]